MSKITEVNEIRAKLGLGLRESLDAYNKFGSAQAAIHALSEPQAMSEWQGPYDALAAERRTADAAIRIAVNLYMQANPQLTHAQACDTVGSMIRLEVAKARGIPT